MHAIPRLVLVLALLPASLLAAGPLRLCIPEYAPYTSTAGGQPHGIGVDRVTALLTAQGVTCTITGASFSDAVAQIRAGEADGFFLASKSPERDAVAVLLAPIVINNWVWVFPADSKLDPKDPAFAGATIVGTVNGSAQAAWLAKNEFHTRILPTADPLPAMLAEHKGINALLVPELVINESIAKAGLDPKAFRFEIADRKPFGIYLAKTWVSANPETFEKLKAAIAALKP